MKFFDRINQIEIAPANLPKSLDLGRFAVQDSGEWKELTSNVYRCQNGQVIRQQFLDEKNLSVHKVFRQIHEDLDKGDFSSIPLIQGVNSLTKSPFEDDLAKNIDHLFAILQNPYSLLDRRIEKVPVARAKRISPKSYQYLAGHTEDWLHKSITSFRPSRILTEELDLNYNVYENQLLVAFIHRTLKYLAEKITNAKYVYEFLIRYSEIVESSSSGWQRKVRRSLGLAGLVYDDPGYKGGRHDSAKTGRILRDLEELQRQMQKMLSYELLDLVDKRVLSNIAYHDTNVLLNHPHYRYLKELWHSLNVHAGKDAQIEQGLSQDEIAGYLVDYGVSLVNYSMIHYLGFKLEGDSDRSWKTSDYDGTVISFNVSTEGVLEMFIGASRINFVVLGTMPQESVLSEMGNKNDTFLLSYCPMDETNVLDSKFVIPVGLHDIECVEAVAMIIRKAIFKEYVKTYIYRFFTCPPILRDFLKYMGSPTIRFEEEADRYRFIRYPKTLPVKEIVKERICRDEVYKRQSNSIKSKIDYEFEAFFLQLEENATWLKNNIHCFDSLCKSPLYEKSCENLSYISCDCGYVVDSTNPDKVIYSNKLPQFSHFSKEAMGIDYIEVSIVD